MAVVRVSKMEGRKKVKRCMVVMELQLQLVYPLELFQGLDDGN